MSMDNQYLRPEDLPATVAEQSPLALLAMTCSNIGADILGAGKPISSLDRHKKPRSDAGDSVRSDSANSDKLQANSIDSNRSSSRNSICANDVTRNSSSSGQKISFKPYEDNPKSESRDQHRSSRTSAATISNNNYDENGCISGSRKRSCDTTFSKRSPGESSPKRSSSSHSDNKNSSSSATSCSPSNVISYTSTGLLELSKNHQLSKAAGDTSASLAFPSPSPLSHFPHPVGHHNQDHHHSLHPYHSPASCRDPHCPACSISSLNGLPTAPANCCNGSSACSHSKTDHPFAFPPVVGPLSQHLNRFSNSQKPFPCHWTANGSYCGKSFATCEELLQHLKTHTLSSNHPSPYSGLGSYYNQAFGSSSGIRSSALDDLRFNPFKFSASASTFRPLVRMPPTSGFPLLPPSLPMYQSSYQQSLSSYYALLNSRLAGPGSLH